MKRQISISIFLALLVVALTMVFIKVNNETKPNEYDVSTEEAEEDVVEIIEPTKTYIYCAKAEDGRLVVYYVKTEEIFLESSIEIHTLPSEIIEQLNQGIYFETEKELYDFLESYSS